MLALTSLDQMPAMTSISSTTSSASDCYTGSKRTIVASCSCKPT